jgi:hypothetical protein
VHRLFATAIFGLAAAGATLAGSGLVVAPHIDPPGTPPHHDHVLAAYRFPIFLMRLQQLYDREPEMVMVSPLATSLAVTVLALLVFIWPRLPRPTLRPRAYVAHPLIARSLWRGPLLLGPPRA